MNLRTPVFLPALLLAACASGPPSPAPSTARADRSAPSHAAAAPDLDATCRAIAADIRRLRDRFPQLADVERARITMGRSCRISFEHRCHRATHAGGWSAAVPNPDPDGVWFYLGLWDESDPAEAAAQINTQPVMPLRTLGGKRVTFLILEGKATRPLGGELLRILKRHGLREGRDP